MNSFTPWDLKPSSVTSTDYPSSLNNFEGIPIQGHHNWPRKAAPISGNKHHNASSRPLTSATLWNMPATNPSSPRVPQINMHSQRNHHQIRNNIHSSGLSAQHPAPSSGSCGFSNWNNQQHHWNHHTTGQSQWSQSHTNADSPPRMNRSMNSGRMKQASHWDNYNHHQRDAYCPPTQCSGRGDWNIQNQNGYANSHQSHWNNSNIHHVQYETTGARNDAYGNSSNRIFKSAGTTAFNAGMCVQDHCNQSSILPHTHRYNISNVHYPIGYSKSHMNSNQSYHLDEQHVIGHWNSQRLEDDMLWRDPHEDERRRDRDLGTGIWGDPDRLKQNFNRWQPLPPGVKPIEVPDVLGWGCDSSPSDDLEEEARLSTHADFIKSKALSIEEQLQNAIAKGYVRLNILDNREMSTETLQTINKLLSKVPRLEQATSELHQLRQSPVITPPQQAELNRLNIEIENLRLEIAIMQSRINEPIQQRESVSSVGSSRLQQWKKGEHTARLHSEGNDGNKDIKSLFDGMTLGDSKSFNLVDPLDDIISDTAFSVPSCTDISNGTESPYGDDTFVDNLAADGDDAVFSYTV